MKAQRNFNNIIETHCKQTIINNNKCIDLSKCISSAPNLTVYEFLGNGAFGQVFKAYDHDRNEYVALKRVKHCDDESSREVEILKKLIGKENCIQL